MVNEWLRVNKNLPTEIGWYATISCWDLHEGMVLGANYWSGKNGSWYIFILERSSQIFETEELALTWAYEHDIEG